MPRHRMTPAACPRCWTGCHSPRRRLPASGWSATLHRPMATMDEARTLALRLPRSYEALVGGRIKIRVGRIVYLAFSADETLMGFGFPKELREALVGSDPQKFLMPRPSDLRYNWVRVRLATIDHTELCSLVGDAWAMVVPRHLAAAHFARPARLV